MKAFDLSSGESALPPKPSTGFHAINHATLPFRNANLSENPAEVMIIDSDSDEAMKEPPPKPAKAMQIDLYSKRAEKRRAAIERKEAASKRKAAARRAMRPVKQMIHEAIPNSQQRQKFYEMHKVPSQERLKQYLEEIRLKDIALRVMVEYGT
ncbi:hypothetical protein AC578_5181 [Pseudocercospora eumusae]|uniref:Uncharacterized protein n=1 Tax=Pseudocercospora eumusae TaxID=321146 RepID=A0A139HMS8_9PEZI|nr:hypothetical protein AC578_5181 [Pseudocercospora eumusae]